MSRKEGGRGLAKIEDSINASIQLEDYIKKHGGRLITAARNKTDNTNIIRIKITRKQNSKKNDCLDISSNKQVKYHTGKLRHG